MAEGLSHGERRTFETGTELKALDVVLVTLAECVALNVWFRDLSKLSPLGKFRQSREISARDLFQFHIV